MNHNLGIWKLGINDFNHGFYWEAHEKWETGWKDLLLEEKEYMQALIQACAAFHLLFHRNRIRPALNLSRTSLNKLKKTQEWVEKHVKTRIEIKHLHVALVEILKIENRDLKKNARGEYEYLRKDVLKYYEELVFQLKAEIHHGEIEQIMRGENFMPYLNWTNKPIRQNVEPHLFFETHLKLELRATEISTLGSSLESVFVHHGPELRLELSDSWILFWKMREEGSRILLAHPEAEQWVATIAFSSDLGVKLIEALKGLKASQTLSLSQFGTLNSFSNLEISIFYQEE